MLEPYPVYDFGSIVLIKRKLELTDLAVLALGVFCIVEALVLSER